VGEQAVVVVEGNTLNEVDEIPSTLAVVEKTRVTERE